MGVWGSPRKFCGRRAAAVPMTRRTRCWLPPEWEGNSLLWDSRSSSGASARNSPAGRSGAPAPHLIGKTAHSASCGLTRGSTLGCSGWRDISDREEKSEPCQGFRRFGKQIRSRDYLQRQRAEQKHATPLCRCRHAFFLRRNLSQANASRCPVVHVTDFYHTPPSAIRLAALFFKHITRLVVLPNRTVFVF